MSILRNDFMLDKNKEGQEVSLSQIEINTVSCSFGAATSSVTRLHRHVLNNTGNQKFIQMVSQFRLTLFCAKQLTEMIIF